MQYKILVVMYSTLAEISKTEDEMSGEKNPLKVLFIYFTKVIDLESWIV